MKFYGGGFSRSSIRDIIYAMSIKTKTPTSKLKHFGYKILLVGFSCLLYNMAFPGFFAPDKAMSFYAFFAFIPFLVVVFDSGAVESVLWGVLFGGITDATVLRFYTIFPQSYIAVIMRGVIAFGFMAPLFRLAYKKKWKGAPFFCAALYTSYCWMMSSSMMFAMPLGLLPYALYDITVLIQICNIVGIFGIAFLVMLPQYAVAVAIKEKTILKENAFRNPIRNSLVVFAVLLAISLAYGIVSLNIWKNRTPEKELSVGVIQMNTSFESEEYQSFEYIQRFTQEIEKLKKENPDVITSAETVVPLPLQWFSDLDPDYFLKNGTSQELPDSWQMDSYLSAKIIESSKGVKLFVSEPELGFEHGFDFESDNWQSKLLDFNSVVLLEDGAITGRYDKIHCAPFKEVKPFVGSFAIREKYRQKGVDFYMPGTERTVFDINGTKVSTPLCFESYFPELISEFDCDVYFNLGSEYYDKTGTGHLFSDMLAVFRAVESRRPFLRVYNSGLTNLISPWGQELERMEEMVRTSDVWKIPVYNCPKSVFAFCPSLLGILCSIYCVLRILFDLNKNRRKK